MSNVFTRIPKIKEQIVIVSKGEGATLHPIYEPCKWDEAFDRYTSWVDFNNSENPEDWTKDTVRNVAKNQKVDVNDIEKYDAFRIQNAKHIFRTAVNDSLSDTPKDNKFRKITSPQGLIKVILNR